MDTQFNDRSMAGARFAKVDLSHASFEQVDFTGTRFRNVDLTDAVIRGAVLVDVEIDAEIDNLRINGVEVAPLIEAELDRLHPERAKLHPKDAAGFREAWPVIERLWEQTAGRARGFEPALLHERVDGEWSFIETQRHLLFATDAWVTRVVLGVPAPWDPLDLPHDEMPDAPGVPWDRDARPTLDDVLALRADRMATVRGVLADLTDEQLAGSTEPVLEPGYPRSASFPVHGALQTVINEEWWHRQFAERDLDALDARS
jgi:uncharacterized protein YjbI with pentapeptide repeats